MRTYKPEKLKVAHSEEEVVAIVRDYLGDWLPEELAHIPEHCRPAKIRDVVDINEVTFNLTRERMSSDEAADDADLLVEMESFFAQACARVAQMQSSASKATSALG
jgi:hypothetical protein